MITIRSLRCFLFFFWVSDELSKASKHLTETREIQRVSSSTSRSSKSDSVSHLWKSQANVDTTRQACILSYIGGYIIRSWKRKHSCELCCCNWRLFLFQRFLEAQAISLCYYKPSASIIKLFSNVNYTWVYFSYTLCFLFLLTIYSGSLFANFGVSFSQPTCHPRLSSFLCKFSCQLFLKLCIYHQCKSANCEETQK